MGGIGIDRSGGLRLAVGLSTAALAVSLSNAVASADQTESTATASHSTSAHPSRHDIAHRRELREFRRSTLTERAIADAHVPIAAPVSAHPEFETASSADKSPEPAPPPARYADTVGTGRTAAPAASSIPDAVTSPTEHAALPMDTGSVASVAMPIAGVQPVKFSTLITQFLQAVASALAAAISSIFGVNPSPSSPGTSVTFSGQPSLLARIFSATLGWVHSLGLDAEATTGLNIVSATPPTLLNQVLNVSQTVFNGLSALVLAPISGSTGKYVVAVHGGGFVTEPTVAHWWSYAQMVQETGATVVVPIYPLAPEGAAATVVPAIAALISNQIEQFGAPNVSVIGDSAGGGLALAAAELLVRDGSAVPASLVLQSPWLDVSLSNPDIATVTDPVLNLTETKANGVLWAGALDPADALVSPLYGALTGLPPTYVYAGSTELLAPDVLLLQQHAVAAGAPFSFILRDGEIHDWALLPFLDGADVQPQIYQQLGLMTETSPLPSVLA
jgi:acetyl esterase/lipase